MTDLPQLLIGEFERITGIFLACFEILNLVGRFLSGKIAKIVIYDQVRINGGNK